MKSVVITSIVAAFFLVGTAVQGMDLEAGDSAKGKEELKICRECHDGTKASKLNPSSKTKKQWARYFKEDAKKLAKKHDDWAGLGYADEMLQNVHRYLSGHALDSDKPQTCD